MANKRKSTKQKSTSQVDNAHDYLVPTFRARLAVHDAYLLFHYLQAEAKKMRKGYYWPIRREDMLNMVSGFATRLKRAEKVLERLEKKMHGKGVANV